MPETFISSAAKSIQPHLDRKNLMKNIMLKHGLWLPAIMLVLYLAAIWFRPLLPIDETRYMTVAWEMFLRKDWLHPLSVNFEPYHHKPPLLFWLINLSWSGLGISRWAGLIPIVLASVSSVYLTAILGKLLFSDTHNSQRIWILMTASVPFLIYGTLVLFDFTLCVFVLLSLISLLYFRKHRRIRYAFAMGLCLGLGVLTKGPVAYLYVLPVALLAPFWVKGFSRPAQWYGSILGAIIVSAIPVLFWLIPVIQASDGDYLYWLIWNQTAGRVTGNFNAAHVRPFWFYLPLVPVMFAPWILFPAFWRGLAKIKTELKTEEGLSFLFWWLVPVFIAFSLISGKQPHYLVPLVPGFVLLISYCLKQLPNSAMAKVMLMMVVFVIAGQAIAAQTVLKRYTLAPIANIIMTNPKRDLAFVRNYHGELGFLARLEKPVNDLEMSNLDDWFTQHPGGWAVVRYKDNQKEIQNYKILFSYPYRGKNLGLVEK